MVGLRACMIDGFGWFEKADYRRSWLLFDEVQYVLPEEVMLPMVMATDLDQQPDHTVVRPVLEEPAAEKLIELAYRDAKNPEFRARVMAVVPTKDLAYAHQLVCCDRMVHRFAALIKERGHMDSTFSVALLLNKLLLVSAASNAVPIVGREYAAELLLDKLRVAPTTGRGTLVSPKQGASLTAFAAGLTLDFVPDHALQAIPFETLRVFKKENRVLLDRHQRHLIEVAQNFAAMPDSAEFDDRLRKLRLDAVNARAELDDAARNAWRSFGSDLAKYATTAVAAGFFSGLAVLRGYSLNDFLTAAGPAAMAALAAVGVGAISAVEKLRGHSGGKFAYLFRASRSLHV